MPARLAGLRQAAVEEVPAPLLVDDRAVADDVDEQQRQDGERHEQAERRAPSSKSRPLTSILRPSI